MAQSQWQWKSLSLATHFISLGKSLSQGLSSTPMCIMGNGEWVEEPTPDKDNWQGGGWR